MKVTSYQKEHILHLKNLYPEDRRLQDVNSSNSGIPETEGSFVYTVFDEGEIVAIVGVLSIWPGLGEVIFYKTPKYNSRVMAYTRVISHLVDTIQTIGKFHRIQAAIPMDDNVAVRFIEFFKFEIESILCKFGPEEQDYVRFVRFEPCHS